MPAIEGLPGSDDLVEAILVGGPENIPHAARSCKTMSGETKVKVAHRGGYEHFERDQSQDEREQNKLTFFWTMRTNVAE